MIFVTFVRFVDPDTVQAFLRRGGSLEEAKPPKCCTFLGCNDDAVTARVEVDA